MKKIIFIWAVVLAVCVFLAVHFCFPPKARAEGKEDITKKDIIYLCQINILLAKKVEAVLRFNNDSEPYYVYDKGNKPISLVPSSKFFLMVKELVRRDGKNTKYIELAEELIEDYKILNITLEQINTKFGKK